MFQAPITPKPRKFLPNDWTVTDWSSVKVFFDQLLDAEINSVETLEAWLLQQNELDAVLQEERAWRYIRLSCNTHNIAYKDAYNFFVTEISPHLAEYSDKLLRKYYQSSYRSLLPKSTYFIFERFVAKELELFRQENIPILSEIEVKSQIYDEITGAMTVQLEGKTLTLQQAAQYLEKPNRQLREEVWRKMATRRLEDASKLDDLLDQLIALRHKVAQNAGYVSFTDYMFKALGRFDYGREECERFHEAIERVVTPIYLELMTVRRSQLGLPTLRPWDLSIDLWGSTPLNPFKTGEELIEKTILMMEHLDSSLAQMIRTMQSMGRLDVSSRIGKAPGGYNYPLYETGVPFIFMNAVGTQGDLTTMVHEVGHAIHAFLTHDLTLNTFKDVPAEIAELASMSMELITMPYWGVFYDSPQDLTRAQVQQLTRSITALPWIATIDAFQTWLYDNPTHTREQRLEQWLVTYTRFHGTVVDFSGLEGFKQYRWQQQLHIYHSPFYYIEYGIAQLGAFQVWRNYLKQPQQGLKTYLQGLALGYTKPIPEVYQAAGIAFDFSESMIKDLFNFVMHELHQRLELLKTTQTV